MSFSSKSFTSKSFSQTIGHKTLSVYGGAGGYGTRISTSQMSQGNFMDRGFGFTDGLDLHVDANEKATLQNLNDRLATYLAKVHKLEKENQRLEKQIREWYETKTVIAHDYSHYFVTIQDLQDKIQAASMVNAKTVLGIDNAKLAAEDFKIKYENELNMRMAVDGDIAGLKRVLDEMNLVKMDLESQYEFLKEEHIMLKKNHEEELALLRSQMGGQVNVSVEAPPPVDLNQVMTEIREHYDALIAKNRKELELWYQSKVADVEQEVKISTDSLVTSRTEIKGLKSTLQGLQIELQSQKSMKMSLEGTLQETKARFISQLAALQTMVSNLEVQMSQLNENIKANDLQYGTLLDLKTRLEAEIVEYRRLLDGEDESLKQVITKVITVKETVIDGRVVESSKKVDVDVDQIE